MPDVKVPTLHLGVLDVPYQKRPTARTRRTPSTMTTHDVAVQLENKYHVMAAFVDQNHDFIAEHLTQSLVNSGEALMQGRPATSDPFGEATSKIEDRFKQFLALQEMDKLGIPGVPTQASLEGRSSRFKKGRSKGGAPRPSFIDTGLYQSSFKAWLTDSDTE